VKSLAKVTREDLNSTDFIRVNQSFLVNKNFIKFIDKKNKLLELKNEYRVPFTTSLKDLLELINYRSANHNIHFPEQ